jgi:replicative superfamily II helicase
MADGSTSGEALGALGLPPVILSAFEKDGVKDLLPIQVKAVQNPHFFTDSTLVIGPTSCGKTFAGEIACVKQMLSNRRCLYLVPFKAIAEDKYVEFRRKYSSEPLGARIVVSTGDRRDQDRALADGDFHLAILTYEKLSAMIVTHPSLLNNVGAIVVDEIQMLSDESRGGELELLLTRVRQISPKLQIIGLSAVVSDLRQFDEWLNAKQITDDHRPVPLREGVISRGGKFEFVEWDGRKRTKGTDSFGPLEGENAVDLCVSFAAQLLARPEEQIIVFAPTVADTQTIAERIARASAHLSPARIAIASLVGLEVTEALTSLNETLRHSIAFHNADLSLEERITVEDGFRQGEIRCVVSTSTLSMGVNLPASSVIIAKPSKWIKSPKWKEVPLSVAEYRNMCGRAGRYGLTKDSFGKSFLIAPSGIDLPTLFASYVELPPEPLTSQLFKRPMADLLLKTLASNLCDTADGCFRFLKKTYAAMEHIRNELGEKEVQVAIDRELNRLLEHGLIEERKKGHLSTTALGMVCAASGHLVESFVAILEGVKKMEPTALDVAYLTSQTKEAGPDAVGLRLPTEEYKNSTKRYADGVVQAETAEPSTLTAGLVAALSISNRPDWDVVHRLKYQCIAYAYVSGIASKIIEDRFSASAGKARAIGSNCSWVADTAAKIAWALNRLEAAKKYERISERFIHGCTDGALLVASASHALHRAEREQLIQAGFDSLVKIVQTPAIEIAKSARIERRHVEEFQKDIIEVLGESLGVEQRQIARLTGLGKPTKLVEELYAIKGTALEQVVEQMLTPPFCSLSVSRIASQREGEADLKLILSNGQHGIAQITAKDLPTDKVGINKSISILTQSPELKPKVHICFGRPDFLPDAIKKADEHARNGHNIKLIPLFVLAEMYVLFQEGKLSATSVAEILEMKTGYISLKSITK